MYDGYTFYIHKKTEKTTIWPCTKGSTCKARLITCNNSNNKTRVLRNARTDHNHPRPSYVIDKKGRYIKL